MDDPMEEQTPNDLDKLAALLASDDQAGFELFREMFFDELEPHRLGVAEQILDILCASPNPWLQKECRYHRAILHVEHGALDQAELILRELLAEDPTLLPEQKARVRVELAYVLDEMSRWKEAKQLYEAGLKQHEQNGDLLGKAKVHNNLGVMLRFQVEQHEAPDTQLDQAQNHHTDALNFAKQANAPREIAKHWHGIGMIHGLKKKYAAAEAAFKQHIAHCQKLDNANDQAISLYDLAALVYQPQQRWDEAHAALAQAIAIFQNSGDDLNLAEALTRLGNLHVAQGQRQQALTSYQQAIERAESLRTRITTPTAQAGARALLDATYTAPISCHLHWGNAAEAFTMAERARARVLADLLGREQATPHAPVSESLLAQRETVRANLEQAYAAGTPEVELEELEQQLAGLDHRIELADPTYASLTSISSLTIEQVQQRLPSGACLLTYTIDAEDRLWIMVVTPSDVHTHQVTTFFVRWLRKHLADHINKEGSWLGILVYDEHHPRLESPRQLFPPLYHALIAPVWRFLEQAQTVYIIPCGPLYYLPIGALTPNLATPPPLLNPGRRVVYAPSATVLLDYCLNRAPSPNSGLLTMAPHDPALHHIEGAARSIANHGGIAIVGDQATRQAFLHQAPSYQAFCFLGHGVFDRDYPMSSQLQLSDGRLYASEILRDLRLQADLVVLAACETGRGHVLRGDEILGLTRAMLYAGTPSLLVTLWRVHEIPTRLLVEKIFDQIWANGSFTPGADPAAALAIAQQWLRLLSVAEVRDLMQRWGELTPQAIDSRITEFWQLTQHNTAIQEGRALFDHPFFWSPFILIGDRRPTSN